MAMRQIALVLLLSSTLLSQENGHQAGAQNQATTPAAEVPAQTAPAQGSSDLAQMRDDLNRMESLNLNMSSEIEFLHDQNLQILLRTNAQMWTLLIRDLRRQIEHEEQSRAVPSVRPQEPAAKQNPR